MPWPPKQRDSGWSFGTGDVRSSQWIDRVNDRLGQLEGEIEVAAHPILAGVKPSDATTPTDVISARTERAADQVERTIYDYVYPRPAAAPARFETLAPASAATN